MKKKLIAAVTSLVMVATLAPATAFATVDSGSVSATSTTQTRGAEESTQLKAFRTAVANVVSQAAEITVATVDSVYDQYTRAMEAYDNVPPGEISAAQNDLEKLETAKSLIANALIAKAEKEIERLTKPGTVDNNTNFGEITKINNKLKALGYPNNKILEATNYDAYEDGLQAKEVYSVIETNMQGITDPTNHSSYSAVETAVKNIQKDEKFKKASGPARLMAKNYSKFAAAEARVENAEAYLKTYNACIEKTDAALKALEKEETEANVSNLKAVIKEVKKALEGSAYYLNEYANYLNSAKVNNITGVDNIIAAAEKNIADQKAVDAFAAKVKAVRPVTLNNLAAVQEVYELCNAGYNNAVVKLTADQIKLLDANTNAALTNITSELEALVADAASSAAKKDAFTEAVVAAFPVPTTSTLTMKDEAALNDAWTAIVGRGGSYYIGGVKIDNALNLQNAKYIDAKAALKGLSEQISAIRDKAEKDAKDFVTAVNNLDKNAKDYEIKLNAAKKLYDALADSYKEGGAYYTKDLVTSGTANTVEAAYTALNKAFKDLEDATKDQAQDTIITELVKGISELKNIEDLTIADKDAVYALRDKKASLSDTAKARFESNYANYNTTLDKAIEAIDKLVVKDVIAQIGGLKQIKADASLDEIQKAKAANAAVRAAYDALNASQKKAVENYVVLQEAEKAVAAAEVQYASDQMKEIAKLDPTALTLEQAKNIQAVADLVAGFDKDQTATIKADKNYKAFETAAKAAAEIIKQANALEQAVISTIADQTYTGKAIEPAVEVKDAAGNVIDPKTYSVSYENNTNAGTATVVVSSITAGGYTGHKTAEFKINPADASKATVTAATKTYTGKTLTTTVKVVVNGKTLAEGTDYDVTYKNNTKVGKATATVTAKGNYTGTIAKNFVVKPGKATVTSLKAASKKVTVKVKAIPGATTYKIAYKQKGSNYKYKTVKTTGTTKTITGLKSGKVYKVKVLAFTKVGNKSYYTGYSTIKTVKVK